MKKIEKYRRMSIQIPVYDDFTIDIKKYPRKDSPKYETDIILINFLMNEEYLQKVAKSYQEAVQFYNECKEYYFVFKSIDGKQNRKMSAKEIIFLINQIQIYFNQNPDPMVQQKFLRKYSPLEQLYYILIRNKDFYLNLIYTVQDAKIAFFQRREINYKLVAPYDFYGNKRILPQVYHTNELLEINAYTQFLIKNRIIKELPEPLFVKNYFDPEIQKQKEEEEKREREILQEKENQEKDVKTIHFS